MNLLFSSPCMSAGWNSHSQWWGVPHGFAREWRLWVHSLGQIGMLLVVMLLVQVTVDFPLYIQDYPSVYQIRDVLREGDIIPIFGTIETTRLTYEVRLRSLIHYLSGWASGWVKDCPNQETVQYKYLFLSSVMGIVLATSCACWGGFSFVAFKQLKFHPNWHEILVWVAFITYPDNIVGMEMISVFTEWPIPVCSTIIATLSPVIPASSRYHTSVTTIPHRQR